MITILTLGLLIAIATYLAPGYTAAAATVLTVLLRPELATAIAAVGAGALTMVALVVLAQEIHGSGGRLLLVAVHHRRPALS